MTGSQSKTANNIQVNRDGSLVTVTALIDDITVKASFDILTLLKDLGHVPSIEEFWNTHVAALLHSSFIIQELESLGLSNPPSSIDVPARPVDSPIQPVDTDVSGSSVTPAAPTPPTVQTPPTVENSPVTENPTVVTNDPGVPNVNTGQGSITVGSVPNDGSAGSNTVDTSDGESTNPK